MVAEGHRKAASLSCDENDIENGRAHHIGLQPAGDRWTHAIWGLLPTYARWSAQWTVHGQGVPLANDWMLAYEYLLCI